MTFAIGQLICYSDWWDRGYCFGRVLAASEKSVTFLITDTATIWGVGTRQTLRWGKDNEAELRRRYAPGVEMTVHPSGCFRSLWALQEHVDSYGLRETWRRNGADARERNDWEALSPIMPAVMNMSSLESR